MLDIINYTKPYMSCVSINSKHFFSAKWVLLAHLLSLSLEFEMLNSGHSCVKQKIISCYFIVLASTGADQTPQFLVLVFAA